MTESWHVQGGRVSNIFCVDWLLFSDCVSASSCRKYVVVKAIQSFFVLDFSLSQVHA